MQIIKGEKIKNRNIFAAIIAAVVFLCTVPGKVLAQTDTTLQKADSTLQKIDSTLQKSQLNIKQDDSTIKYTRPDSLQLAKLVELTIQGEDELIEELYDSLWVASNYTLVPIDSLHLQQLAFPPRVYTAKELKRMHRDSLWAYKDSVIRATPRVLQTYMFTDSVKNQRMFLWNSDPYFNKATVVKPDTTYNDYYSELPYEKYDAGTTNLGISGAAMQYNNYFIRPQLKVFPFFNYYLPYSYTPQTMVFYNTKTPYTELGYWGTLFASKKKEVTNIKFLHTQNLTPAFNINVLYQRFGASGMLINEKTDNRTFSITGNYLGKKYLAHGGYIFNRIKRDENGGISDPKMVMDTLVDPKIIPVTLSNAKNVLKRNTFFITHSYGIPFRFLQKRDSLGKRDSVALGEGTMAYIGHSADVSFYSKKYTDEISLSDELARDFYDNKFYINPTQSADSMRVFMLENKVFIRLQPWAKEAIVSKLDAGLGHQYLSLYGFTPGYFLSGNGTTKQNNMYMYFGASGSLKKYFSWEGMGVYHFAGYYQNDFSVDAKVRFSTYPSKIKQGIHLSGKLHISLERPNFFYNNAYTNHYVWKNNFDKTTQTKVEAKLEIPDWKLEAFFGYALLNNNTYFDNLSIVRQNTSAMNILSAYLKKDIKLWKFHMDNKVLFQLSSDNDVVPLPKLSLNLRYYFQFNLVKNVLTAQLGANATFNTKYYAQGYSPALGVFYNQNKEKIGQTPYIDIFVNLQWKRAGIYVKYMNAGLGWPNNDYYSAYHYLKPQKALKFGIYWPFYIK